MKNESIIMYYTFVTFLPIFFWSFQKHFLWTFLSLRTAASRHLHLSVFLLKHATAQRVMSATWAVQWQETPSPMLPGTEIMSASTLTLTTTSPTHVASAPWWFSKSDRRTVEITLSLRKTLWAEWSVQLNSLLKVKPPSHTYTPYVPTTWLVAESISFSSSSPCRLGWSWAPEVLNKPDPFKCMEGGRFAKLKSALIHLWINVFELTVREKIKAEREEENEELLIHKCLKALVMSEI